MNISVNDKLIYWGAGCGIGLVIGLLFAPQSGHEIRHTLTSKIDDLTNKVQEKVQQSSIRETAGQTWRDVVERSRNVAHIGRARVMNRSRPQSGSTINPSKMGRSARRTSWRAKTS